MKGAQKSLIKTCLDFGMKKRGAVTILSCIRLHSENICPSRLAYGSWGCLLEAKRRGMVSIAQRLCLMTQGPDQGDKQGRMTGQTTSFLHAHWDQPLLPPMEATKYQFPSPSLCPGGIPGCSPGNGIWAPSPGSPVPRATWDKSLPAFVGG